MSQKDLNSSFEGKINLCILALNPDFVPFYIEREIKFSKELYENIDSKISDSYIFMSITDIDYKIINNDEIEVKLNIQIIANMYNESEYNLVENITSNESSPKIKDLSNALTIYYANAGEKIWDIAKHYGTTMEKIQDENDIDFEVLDSDRAILIPIY
jgi:LysM repeat protein